jgi:hypothetical protein
MSIESGWSVQAVTALDLSALAASENIVDSSQDTQRQQPTVREEKLGGTTPPLLDIHEQTANITVSDGPGFPLKVAGSPTDFDSGLIIPVASTNEGSSLERAAQYLVQNQVDQAFASNLAARDYTDTYLGRIVDYTA